MKIDETLLVLLLAVLTCWMSPPEVSAQTPEEPKEWALDLAFQQYFLPAESDLSTPVASLYWNDWLFESRYNYEDRDATSLWLGRVFSFGSEWEFELTPMVGGVFGSFEGMAPGFKGDISWKRLNFYTEIEYVFDFDTRENNFFYSWSELTVGLLDWLRLGIVGNRTRAYDSAVELDRGPIVSFEVDPITLSCTALNLDDDAIFILGVTYSFGG